MTTFLLMILLIATLASGLIVVLDFVLLARFRKAANTDVRQAKPWLIDLAYSFFPFLLLVLLLKSFVFQFVTVPTGSLKPTVIPGDFLVVNMFAYGLKNPVTSKTLIKVGDPKRGDIAVLHWPTNPKVQFVKRVIGVPGDHISYVNKLLYINGHPIPQTFISNEFDTNGGPNWPVQRREEDLFGVKHAIYVCPPGAVNCPDRQAHNFHNLIVPKGYYFIMGDNRDDSDDSRNWGFVPKANLIGKATRILFSWDSKHYWLRFNRIWQGL